MEVVTALSALWRRDAKPRSVQDSAPPPPPLATCVGARALPLQTPAAPRTPRGTPLGPSSDDASEPPPLRRRALRMSESSCSVSVRWFSADVRLAASPVYAMLITEISTEMSTEKIVTPFA